MGVLAISHRSHDILILAALHYKIVEENLVIGGALPV